jgi:hypothetical protein
MNRISILAVGITLSLSGYAMGQRVNAQGEIEHQIVCGHAPPWSACKGGPGNDHIHTNGGRQEGNGGADLLTGWGEMVGGEGADTFVPIASSASFVGFQEWGEGGYARGKSFIEDFKPGIDKVGLRAELSDGTILSTQEVFRTLDTNGDGKIGEGGGDVETWLGTAHSIVDALEIIVLNDPIYIHGVTALRAEDCAMN